MCPGVSWSVAMYETSGLWEACVGNEVMPLPEWSLS